MLGFAVVVVDWGPRFKAARFAAHSPALGHSCEVSVRWSRQNLLAESVSWVGFLG
jgi:hypothetical protein